MNDNREVMSDDELNEKGEEAAKDGVRARNRTVMLTPDITGQVRAMLAGEGPMPAILNPTESSRREPLPIGSTYTPGRGGFGNRGQEPQPKPLPESVFGSQERRPVMPAYYHPAENISAPLVGFLISFDALNSGEVYELRVGRWLVTNEHAGAGSFLVINDPSVSPLHAVLRVGKDGAVQVLDQLSENGTVVKKGASGEEEILTGSMAVLEHGDRVSFGNRSFVLCLIPGIGELLK